MNTNHGRPKTSPNQWQDTNPEETHEWIDAIDSLFAIEGTDRAFYVLNRLQERARVLGIGSGTLPYSAYRNSISLEQQPYYPGDLATEERLTSIIRWNALAMVMRANKAYGELGGHIASFASAAEIFEVGFNHFFRAPTEHFGGDLVYFQPHSAPGIYARAFLEGRISEEQIAHYRQEVGGVGLCSYPHPWLMSDFWQLPTGSMGIGPINAIYQARFMRYLQGRELADTDGRHVWGVFGDGEMDEPESIAGLTLAAREGLDNLTFIINCNLQRLDGPVRGNGQIIQELEALFVGAGWNVIKVLWGSEWDELFLRDTNNVLLRRFAETVDGQYQNLGSKDGDYNRTKFFDANPESAELAKSLSDEQINTLKRGGHDVKKLYAAFAAAKAHKGGPTVILAKTKKGYGMGGAGESRMTAHQAKKLDIDALLAFRDRFNLPLDDVAVSELQFYKPAENSPEIEYLQSHRRVLGGYLPQRSSKASNTIDKRAALATTASFALEAKGKEMSTTMAAVRLLGNLLKDPDLGPRIVPIVADEARTFGMDNLFRQIGIYAPAGQLYEPEDAGSMLYYKEASSGQLLEEGITEAGAISSWTAAATAYSAHDIELLPFYIYYSMFGFQRVGDLIWAAADQRARGFLLGATAGRTTLGGEGLQHQDGSSHMSASAVPNCRSYDPAFAYELAIIMEYGMKRMLDEKRDEFFYITVMNERYAQPSMPANVEQGIIKGLYRCGDNINSASSADVRLIGSGAILLEVMAAADILTEKYNITSEVFSATSYTELSREAAEIQRKKRLGISLNNNISHVERLLEGEQPIVVASDYVRAYPQQISAYVSAPFVVLGTDGFGRSDNRQALRDFFEVSRQHIVLAAIDALVQDEKIAKSVLTKAIIDLEVNTSEQAPFHR